MAKAKAAPKVTQAELRRYFALEKKRLAAQRIAKDFGKLQEELEEKFLAFVEAKGGKERSTTCSGYRLFIEQKDGSVSWLGEFLKIAGEDRAEELRKAAPKKDVLVVEPPDA